MGMATIALVSTLQQAEATAGSYTIDPALDGSVGFDTREGAKRNKRTTLQRESVLLNDPACPCGLTPQAPTESVFPARTPYLSRPWWG